MPEFSLYDWAEILQLIIDVFHDEWEIFFYKHMTSWLHLQRRQKEYFTECFTELLDFIQLLVETQKALYNLVHVSRLTSRHSLPLNAMMGCMEVGQ